MFHERKNIRKIIIKRASKVCVEKREWDIILFMNFTENKTTNSV